MLPNGKYSAAIKSFTPTYTPPNTPEATKQREAALRIALSGIKQTASTASTATKKFN